MSDNTKIEWADATWNPITGCTPISEGCTNCYARKMFGRNLWDYDFTPGTYHEDRKLPNWRKRKRVFVCSMGDLFHDEVEFWQIDNVLNMIGPYNAEYHTFIILTKRPQRALDYSVRLYTESHRNGRVFERRATWERLWIGATTENQDCANSRIPILAKIPAKRRFISVEPMLGPVDLMKDDHTDLAWIDEMDWVIAGPETGIGARPCEEEWLMDLKRQCDSAGVPFFLKRHADGSKAEPELQEFPK